MHGAKVENVSSKICHRPCEDLVVLLTEINSLRMVTNNLLDDLDRVVRHTYVHALLYALLIIFVDATFALM